MTVDYQARLARLNALDGADAVAIVPGPNMVYFTGLHVHLSERPTIAIITADGLHFIMPKLEAIKVENRADLDAQLFIWSDEDGFAGAFQAAADALNLNDLRFAVDGQTMRVFEYLAFQRAGVTHIGDVGQELLGIRAIKSAEEINLLRDAVERSEQALDALLKWVQPGMTEREIASKLGQLLQEYGMSELSFAPLVQVGPSSALPHGMPGDRALAQDDFILIDFGGKIDGYPADITRTFCLGTPTVEMSKIYDTVLAANQAGIAAAKPGVPCGDVDKAARDVIEAAGYGEYFTHRTGHGLGLEGHESPQIAAGVTDTLQPGMVFTVEPGVYVPGLGGVRIEDNIAVTADGIDVLTSYPRRLEVE